MNSPYSPPPLPNTAEDWVVRLQSPTCSTSEHEAFEDWLAAAPGNPMAYARAERLHGLASALADDPELRAEAHRARHALRARPARSRWSAWALATAAVVTLAGVLGYRMLVVPGLDTAPVHLETALGERKTSVLEDGSRVVLDTDSQLQVAYTAGERTLTLARGRVHVQATRDPARPMRVRAGNGDVRVIGTTFQVRHLGGEVDVALFEGAVEVNVVADDGSAVTRDLAPGQRVVYHDTGAIDPVAPLAPDEADAWLDGRLVFNEWPLEVLLAEANRYASAQITLADPALADLRVSGQVRAGDQDSLAAALEVGWGLRADRGEDGTIVLSRE